MSYSFASGDYYADATGGATLSYPLTIAAYVYTTTWNSTDIAVALAKTDPSGGSPSTNDSIDLRTEATTGAWRAYKFNSAAASDHSTTATTSAGLSVWVPVVGIYLSDGTIKIYAGNTSTTASSTGLPSPDVDIANLRYVVPGAAGNLGGNYAGGLIAEIAAWNADLSASGGADLSSYMTGTAANRIGTPLFYYPMETNGDLSDTMGVGGTLTAVAGSATWNSEHPIIDRGSASVARRLLLLGVG